MLANQARQQAGAPALTLDSGLSQAARVHAQAMVEARELSHQFKGEPSLPQRLAATTNLQLDQEGENVALDYDAQHGHEHLMLSPPHRANLLNPAYNVVGLGVVRSGDRLYIVQDFGHALPNYSAAEVKDRIATAVNRVRRQASQPELQRRDLLIADEAACSMAQADKLGTLPVKKLAERFYCAELQQLASGNTAERSSPRHRQPELCTASQWALATGEPTLIRRACIGWCCRSSENSDHREHGLLNCLYSAKKCKTCGFFSAGERC